MRENKSNLSVNTEVLEKMAELAACEVEGVASLSKRAIDLKGAVKSKVPFKGVKIESVNGALSINIYITIDSKATLRTVAEEVQKNVKEKIQNMTGSAVTKINVIVADVTAKKEEAEA
jgi:uncharacterized alkaline shock family protein YloU